MTKAIQTHITTRATEELIARFRAIALDRGAVWLRGVLDGAAANSIRDINPDILRRLAGR